MRHCSLSAREVAWISIRIGVTSSRLRWTQIRCTRPFQVSSTRLLDWNYDCGGKGEFLPISKYHNLTPVLFKAEFQGMRMIAPTSKCYYTENTKSTSFAKPKISCKGVRKKKQNLMSWDRCLEALNGSLNIATNMGFRLYEQGIVTYSQTSWGSVCTMTSKSSIQMEFTQFQNLFSHSLVTVSLQNYQDVPFSLPKKDACPVLIVS